MATVANPKNLTFTSPDHSATYDNGDPKITYYDLAVFPRDVDPNTVEPIAIISVPKVQALGSGPYTRNIEDLIELVPSETIGAEVRVRPKNGLITGVWGVGKLFNKLVAPATCDVTLLS